MMTNEIILVLIFALWCIAILFVNNSMKEDMLDKDRNEEYIAELSEILYYAQIALEECIDDPEEREKIQAYIDNFDDLIIEDCIYFNMLR